MGSERNVDELIDRYLDGKASAEEKQIIESWYLKSTSGETLTQEELLEEHALSRNRLNAYLKEQDKLKRLWPRIAAAGSVLLVLSFGIYIYSYQNKRIKQESSVAQDIPPGKNAATIILQDGRVIDLSDSKTGISISKDQLLYDDGSQVDGSGEELNEEQMVTARTPRGGTYKITLPDGTHISMNSASSLRFQKGFSDKTRSVELSGEAYFEVAKDKVRPFIVKTGNQVVEVLGTHFNINNYEEEKDIKTTLLEGAVRVYSLDNSVATQPGGQGPDYILKPGEQAVNNGKKIEVRSVEADNIIDWKNNDFVFNGDDIQTALRKISRWYDVEIVYADDLPKNFSPGGWISRNNNLSAVLKIIEASGFVHIKVEGRRLLVTR